MNSTEFLNSSIQIIKKLSEFSNTPIDSRHPLHEHLVICNDALNNDGIVTLDSGGLIGEKLARVLLDCAILIQLTDGSLRHFVLGKTLPGNKKAVNKITTRITISAQYRGLIVELYTYSWNAMMGHEVELWEEEGLPDLKVEIPNLKIPFLIACTHRDNSKTPPLGDYIDRAEKQIRQATEKHDRQYFGVSLIDVSIPVGTPTVDGDVLPKEIVDYTKSVEAILDSGLYRHVKGVLLVWDEFFKKEIKDNCYYCLRRRSVVVPASKLEALQVFKGYDAFMALDIVKKSDQMTSGKIGGIRLSDVPRNYAWFKATCYGLSDQLVRFESEEEYRNN